MLRIKKAQLSLLTMDNEEDTKAHFNLDELLLDNKNKKNRNKKKLRGEYDEDKVQKDDFQVREFFETLRIFS
jgi:hypothetical protein